MSGYLESPPGWRRSHAEGPGPFVTRETFTDPDGVELHWESRAHRKSRRSGAAQRSGIWWRPDQRNWWMAMLFAVGALLFVVGGVIAEWNLTSGLTAARVFAVGSLFFTAAAYLQYVEAVNVERQPGGRTGSRAWRPASWEPRRIDWLSTAIQLVGTVLFNLSTFAGLKAHLSTAQSDLFIWTPDALGSVAFLLSSELAYAEICHRWFALRGRGLSWRIGAVNLTGSVAFGAAAVASLVLPGGHVVSGSVSNDGTWLGGVLFFTGALLLVPEVVAHRAARRARRSDWRKTHSPDPSGPSASPAAPTSPGGRPAERAGVRQRGS